MNKDCGWGISRFGFWALIACATSMASLFCPIYSAVDRYETVFTSVVRWWNLPEFSGWGGIAISLPFLYAALIVSGLSNNAKMFIWFPVTALGAFTIPEACFAAKIWLIENVNSNVQFRFGLRAYFVFLIATSLLVFISIRKDGVTLKTAVK